MKTKVQADMINGIYVVTAFDVTTSESITSPELFYSLLSDTFTGVICAEIDKDMLERITNEYGITTMIEGVQ